MLTRPAGHEAEAEARKSEAEDEAQKDHLSNVNISMMVGRISTKIYIFISLSWAFFENRKNSGLTPGQNDDPMNRT